MPGMPWIKLYTEALDDCKLAMLDDGLWRRFFELCMYAGECDAEGYLVDGEEPLTIQQIAWRLRVDPKQLEQELAALEAAGELVFYDEQAGAWCITRFSERQGRSQSGKRELWREQKKRQRSGQAEESVEESTEDSIEDTGEESVEESTEDTSKCPDGVRADTVRTPAGVRPLEKEGEGEEEIEGIPPSGSRGEPRANTPPTEASESPDDDGSGPRAVFAALSEVCCMDQAANRGRLNRATKGLRDGGYTAEDIRGFGEWWKRYDWRGKRGDLPTPEQVIENILKSVLWHEEHSQGQLRASTRTIDHESAARMAALSEASRRARAERRKETAIDASR